MKKLTIILSLLCLSIGASAQEPVTGTQLLINRMDSLTQESILLFKREDTVRKLKAFCAQYSVEENVMLRILSNMEKQHQEIMGEMAMATWIIDHYFLIWDPVKKD